MRIKEVEILAPAGSYESMVAAIQAGSDAVYIGGNRFGARAFANNLDEPTMLNAIDYAHLHGCRLYMTVNTLMKEEELGELYDYLSPYYRQGLDAVIVQDFGVFTFIRKHFPDLPIHASTQMTVTGAYGARILKDWGATRVVTARELSLKEIHNIHRNADVEIESFIHGALCYCYSGQCLFSSLIGGRSGNRGRCAQTCRLPFEVNKEGRTLVKREEQYVLSLKDLCTLNMIPDIIQAGVYSLKIEGRMKSPRYTAGVVSMYRKYVDQYLKFGREGYQVDPKDKKMLLDLFDRGGFTEGYYRQHNSKDMVVLKEKPAFREGNQELFDYLDKTFVDIKKQEPVTGTVTIKEGESISLYLTYHNVSIEAEGQMPLEAVNQPVTEEKIEKQMRKTGNTPFFFEELSILLNGNVFVPVQALNELRREGFALLEQEIAKQFRRQAKGVNKDWEKADIFACDRGDYSKRKFNVSLEQREGLWEVINFHGVSEIYLDSAGFSPDTWKKIVDQCHNKNKKCFLAMPHIFREEAERFFLQHLRILKEAGFDGLLIRSLEEAGFAREQGLLLPLVFDHSMYTYNSLAAETMRECGGRRLTLPVELNSRELEKRGSKGEELIVYGYLPMMVTAQCVHKTTKGCTKKPDLLYLKDRKGKQFAVKNQCVFCYNTIYNSSPLSLLGEQKLIDKLEPGSIRMNFTVESKTEIETLLKHFYDSLVEGQAVENPLREYTRGHFKRGVE